MIEKENVLRILREAISCLERNDHSSLGDLSNQMVHSSSVSQDGSTITLAVILYSLGKIFERNSYKEYSGWDGYYKKILNKLNDAVFFLEKDDIKNFRKSLKNIRVQIDKISNDFKSHISDVFRKAKLNKAFKIHEHGISMEKTSKLLGISLWELASYAGQKSFGVVDKTSERVSVKERIKLVEDFFEI